MASGARFAASASVLCVYLAALFLSATVAGGTAHAETALVPRTTPHGYVTLDACWRPAALELRVNVTVNLLFLLGAEFCPRRHLDCFWLGR